jgi:hypothetical protein
MPAISGRSALPDNSQQGWCCPRRGKTRSLERENHSSGERYRIDITFISRNKGNA